jgi:hypothetical protein
MGPGGLLGLQNQCDLPQAGWVGSIPSRSRHRTRGILSALAVALGVVGAAPMWGQDTTAAPTRDSSATDSVFTQRQDTTRAMPVPRGSRARRVVPRDTVPKPPISPARAMLYSFAVPGLGQAKLDRSYAGALFLSIEVVSIAMARQAIIDRNYAAHHVRDSVVATYETDPTTGAPLVDSTGHPIPATFAYNRYTTDRLGARRLHVEDWVAALIFNHLFAGADAFVAAQLWDLPGHVRPPKFEAYVEPNTAPRGGSRFVVAMSIPLPR